MNKILVISPSGNFYGSEQVLLDYLQCTELCFDVMIPANSMFAEIAGKAKMPHQLIYFDDKRLKKLYLQLFMKLLSGKYDTVYLNEAGHSRYVLLLARLFRSKRFVIHVRIAEDTAASRWKLFSAKNTRLIAISENIRKQLPCSCELLYDLYIFSDRKVSTKKESTGTIFNVGVIGRITFTKGLAELVKLMDYIKENHPGSAYQFRMYGDIPATLANDAAVRKLQFHNNTVFMGFIASKKDIYEEVHVVLHMSKTEPLGRIFLEAIDEEKPLVGFNSAGIGEIGKLTGLDELLCDPGKESFEEEIFALLEHAKNNYAGCIEKIDAGKKLAVAVFSAAAYTRKLDNILLG